MFLVPTQTQAQEEPSLQVINGGIHTIPLKAIQDSDGDITPQNDFEIEPQNVVTLTTQGQDFHVIPSDGSIFAVKITDQQRQTTDVVFSPDDGRVSQDLAAKAYLLDIIVELDDDKYLYETVLAVLAPGQTINTQTIIQNFVEQFKQQPYDCSIRETTMTIMTTRKRNHQYVSSNQITKPVTRTKTEIALKALE